MNYLEVWPRLSKGLMSWSSVHTDLSFNSTVIIRFFHRHKQSSVLPSICKDFKTINVREDLELEKAEELLKKSEEATEEFFAAPEEDEDDEDDEDYVPMEVDASAPDKSQAGIFVDTN